jgi:uncharacterized membrane protein
MQRKIAKILRNSTGMRRLLVAGAAMVAILAIVQPALAQIKTTDLTLWLRGGQNNNYDNVVKAGQDNKFFLEVRNVGTERINNIQFSSDASGEWIVAFTPSSLAYLDPGVVQTLDVNIHPPANQSRGSHSINIIAQTAEIRKVESFFVMVSLASSWMWVWGVVILVIVVAFYMIYRVFSGKK